MTNLTVLLKNPNDLIIERDRRFRPQFHAEKQDGYQSV
jgi:hypothetical protein